MYSGTSSTGTVGEEGGGVIQGKKGGGGGGEGPDPPAGSVRACHHTLPFPSTFLCIRTCPRKCRVGDVRVRISVLARLQQQDPGGPVGRQRGRDRDAAGAAADDNVVVRVLPVFGTGLGVHDGVDAVLEAGLDGGLQVLQFGGEGSLGGHRAGGGLLDVSLLGNEGGVRQAMRRGARAAAAHTCTLAPASASASPLPSLMPSGVRVRQVSIAWHA